MTFVRPIVTYAIEILNLTKREEESIRKKVVERDYRSKKRIDFPDSAVFFPN